MRSALRPFIAVHVDVATTATPFETMIGRPDFSVNRSAGSSRTLFTPGIASARDASKRRTFPPKTGERSMTACSMPGSRTSSP
jgi:hypothetical protein